MTTTPLDHLPYDLFSHMYNLDVHDIYDTYNLVQEMRAINLKPSLVMAGIRRQAVPGRACVMTGRVQRDPDRPVRLF